MLLTISHPRSRSFILFHFVSRSVVPTQTTVYTHCRDVLLCVCLPCHIVRCRFLLSSRARCALRVVRVLHSLTCVARNSIELNELYPHSRRTPITATVANATHSRRSRETLVFTWWLSLFIRTLASLALHTRTHLHLIASHSNNTANKHCKWRRQTLLLSAFHVCRWHWKHTTSI